MFECMMYVCMYISVSHSNTRPSRDAGSLYRTVSSFNMPSIHSKPAWPFTTAESTIRETASSFAIIIVFTPLATAAPLLQETAPVWEVMLLVALAIVVVLCLWKKPAQASEQLYYENEAHSPRADDFTSSTPTRPGEYTNPRTIVQNRPAFISVCSCIRSNLLGLTPVLTSGCCCC